MEIQNKTQNKHSELLYLIKVKGLVELVRLVRPPLNQEIGFVSFRFRFMHAVRAGEGRREGACGV